MRLPDLDAAAAAWTVLSTAFGKLPEDDFVTALRDPDRMADWVYDDRASRHGVDLLIRSGRSVPGDSPAESLDEIVSDHRRLFVGPRPLLAAPWESVHRSREGLVFERQTLEVRAAYREFGLQSPLLNKEPDDHIALEASFVSALALGAMAAVEGDDDHGAQRHLDGLRRFHQDHLSQWVPALLQRVEDHARTDYHLGMAALCEGALDQLTTALR